MVFLRTFVELYCSFSFIKNRENGVVFLLLRTEKTEPTSLWSFLLLLLFFINGSRDH